MECLLSFIAESFVVQFAVKKFKDKIFRTINLPVFCMVVEFGCSHRGRNKG